MDVLHTAARPQPSRVWQAWARPAGGPCRSEWPSGIQLPDVRPHTGELLGATHMIRADLYHGQPCPHSGGLYTFNPLNGYYRCEVY